MFQTTHEKTEEMIHMLTGKTLTKEWADKLLRLVGRLNDEKYEKLENLYLLMRKGQYEEAKQLLDAMLELEGAV